jgi:hypothetical protein
MKERTVVQREWVNRDKVTHSTFFLSTNEVGSILNTAHITTEAIRTAKEALSE